VNDLLEQEPDTLHFKHSETTLAIHAHCHAKSIMNPAFMRRLAERLPGRKAIMLDTACCGMAGAFGALAEKYDLSVQVAQDLIDKLENHGRETQIIASGTSLPASKLVISRISGQSTWRRCSPKRCLP